MNDGLLSDLAVAQLKELPPEAGRKLLDALQRLRLFPESAPRLNWEGYEAYRQVVIRPYRALSLMNLGEVFHITGRRRGQAVAEQLLTRIKQLPIHILAVDEARVLAAARLKLSYRLAYANAFAAAAAAELDAALLTGDPELLALAPVFQIEPLARSG